MAGASDHDFAAQTILSMIEAHDFEISGENVDLWRFPEPTSFRRCDKNELIYHIANTAKISMQMNSASEIMEDEYSRHLLRQIYIYRALGPCHIMLPTNIPEYWKNYERAMNWRRQPSAKFFGDWELSLYAGQFSGYNLEIECWLANIVFSFMAKQYFFRRDGVVIEPEEGDFVIDAGACFGDTSLAFATVVGENGRVFSFEPLPAQYNICLENLSRNIEISERVELSDHALSNTSGQLLMFEELGAGSRVSGAGTVQAQTITIDDFVCRRALKKIDFIKMDIEGSEEAALRGAEGTIRRFHPKLAISAYHKPHDLFAIPLLIREILPSYRIFVDHYTIHSEETIVYAI